MANDKMPEKFQPDNYRQCSVDGCSSDVRAKKLCGAHYQRVRKYGSLDLPAKTQPEWITCSIDGCQKPSRTRLGKYCEKHYYRNRRNGNFDAPVWGKEGITKHGYVMRRDLEHPASAKNGYLYIHREVLFNAIGPGQHNCYWCKTLVEWGGKGRRRLVVDHLDNVKTNNARDNLVAACNRCNANRGLFTKWVIEHRGDPFIWRLYLDAVATGR